MNAWLQLTVGGSWGLLMWMLMARFTRSDWAKVRLECLAEAVRRKSASDPELWSAENQQAWIERTMLQDDHVVCHPCPSCGYIHPDLNDGDDQAINRIKDFVTRKDFGQVLG